MRRRQHLVHVVIPCVLALSAPCIAQSREERIDWLRNHAIPLAEPAADSFDDLNAFRDFIGPARIIFLGESSHGDGAAFETKARLVRFLHQELGFDLLVWESGMWECRQVDLALADGTPGPEAADLGILSLWADSAQCQELFEYVALTRQSERPLRIAGMDCMATGSADTPRFLPALSAFFDQADPALLDDRRRRLIVDAEAWLRSMDPARVPVEPPGVLDGLIEVERLLADNVDHLAFVHGPAEVAFMRRCLRNTIEFATARCAGPLPTPLHEFRRDAVMADNIRFLAETFHPGSRIIVWCHNVHAGRNGDRAVLIDAPPALAARQRPLSAGHLISTTTDLDIRTVLFTAYAGTHGAWWEEPTPVPPAAPDSLEGLLHESGYDRAFLDLRRVDLPPWLREPLQGRETVYWSQAAIWPNCFDGVVFLDEMTPSRPAGDDREDD